MADASTTSLASLLRDARAALAEAGIEDPALDARLIVEHFSGTSRTDAIATPDRMIGRQEAASVVQALKRRIGGEPVHRILGFREFYGLRLTLSPETLEPRPDTETLVDALLPFVRETALREGPCRILDLGTGTGAIALALLAQVEMALATGADISVDALTTAARNAQAHGLGARFTTVESDWLENIFGRFHVIVANPPYICTQELMALQREVRNFDPARALDGGADGLDPYRMIARDAKEHLENSGRVAVEIGHSQRHDVTKLFSEAGYNILDARCDLSGNDRVLVFGC